MAKPKSTPESVSEYIQKLDPALAEVVEALRRTILDTDPEIAEQIKWNSPSFYYAGDMKPFDPKEYKRDIVVMNLHKGHVLLVFPTGAKVKDGGEILEGDYKDGRRIAHFHSLEEALAKAEPLRKVIRDWLELVEK